MWRLILYFDYYEEHIEVREYKTYRGAIQAGRYWWRHRPDIKEYEVTEVVD